MRLPLSPTLLLACAFATAPLGAQTFTVTVDDGRHIGSGASNPANGGVFVAHANQGDTVDGILSDQLNSMAENVETSTQTFTAEFVDDTLGLGLTGLKIQYEVTASAFRFDGTNTVTALLDEGSGHLGVRGGSNNSTIDSVNAIDNNGEFEFIRLTIDNVSVAADPNGVLAVGETIVVDGFVGHTIRVGSTTGSETGSVYIAGTTDAGTTPLASFDGTEFRQYLTWDTPQLGVDSYPAPTAVPSSGNATQIIDVQGFKAQFSIVSDPDGADGFRITDIQLLPDDMISLTWNSRADRVYTVLFSLDGADFSSDAGDDFDSQGDSTTHIFPNPAVFGEPPTVSPTLLFKVKENE